MLNSPVHVTSHVPFSVRSCAPGSARSNVSCSPRHALPAITTMRSSCHWSFKSILPTALLRMHTRIRVATTVGATRRPRSTLFRAPRFSNPTVSYFPGRNNSFGCIPRFIRRTPGLCQKRLSFVLCTKPVVLNAAACELNLSGSSGTFPGRSHVRLPKLRHRAITFHLVTSENLFCGSVLQKRHALLRAGCED